MTRQVLLVFLLVTLFSASVNGICNIVSLSLTCSLLPILCSLNNLLNDLCPDTRNSLINIQFTSGTINLDLDTDLLGLNIQTGGSASVSISLLKAITISTDLNISGVSTVTVSAGSIIQVGGNVNIGPTSVLEVGGNVVVGGATLVRGTLHFTGSAPSSTNDQTAWLNSTNTVNVNGTSGAPAQVTGNGGVNADVVVNGYATAGETSVYTSVYVSKSLQVLVDSTFKVNGNVTVEGDSTVNGNLHLGSLTIGKGNNQTVWFRPLSSVLVVGTATNLATMTGNGGVHGDCYLGDYGGIAPGNSPGTTHYAGNLLMSDMSFLQLECDGPGTDQFDKITMSGNFYRGGSVQVTFGNGYVPNNNDRIAWSYHSGATGFFKAVYGDYMTGVFTNLTTGYVYSEPDDTCYCQCVSV